MLVSGAGRAGALAGDAMVRLAVWLLGALWLASPGRIISAPAPVPACVAAPAAGQAATADAAQAAAPAAVPAADTLSRLLPGDPVARLHVPCGLAVWDCPAVLAARTLAEETGALAELLALRGAVQLATRHDPAQTLRFLLGGELALAVYDGTPTRLAGHPQRELLALARTGDADGLELALDSLLAMADGDHDVKRLSYRDAAYARVDRGLLVAAVGDVLLVTGDDDLLAGAIDLMLDAPAPAAPAPAAPAPAATGADDVTGRAASQADEPDVAGEVPLATFSLDAGRVRPADLRAVRQPGVRLLGRRIAHPLANLLFGGLTLADGRVEGSLASRGDELSLHALLPAPPVDAPAAWFPAGPDAFRVPTTEHTLAVLSARRDLADWWRRRESLLPDDSQAALAKADENMGVLFAGLSPAEDVFGAVAPELALVVDRQIFEGAGPAPEVRLPAFCLVGRLQDAPGFGDALAVAFQSLVSFMNMDRAQDGKASFLLDVQEHEGVALRTARLLPRAADGAAAGLDANWSPAVAVADAWLLIGSSAEQVRRLITSIHAGAGLAREGVLGVDLDVSGAIALARENRAALVANRILEEGAEPEDAGRDIDMLLRLASALERVRGDVRRSEAGLELDLMLALAPAASAPGPPAR
jgi:hypothetical protein